MSIFKLDFQLFNNVTVTNDFMLVKDKNKSNFEIFIEMRKTVLSICWR